MEPEKPWSADLEQELRSYEDRIEFERWFPWPPLADILDYEKFEANAPKYEYPDLDPWHDYGEDF